MFEIAVYFLVIFALVVLVMLWLILGALVDLHIELKEAAKSASMIYNLLAYRQVKPEPEPADLFSDVKP